MCRLACAGTWVPNLQITFSCVDVGVLHLQVMCGCVDYGAAGVCTPNLQIGWSCGFFVSAFMSSPRAWADQVDLHIEPLAIG